MAFTEPRKAVPPRRGSVGRRLIESGRHDNARTLWRRHHARVRMDT